MNEARKIPYSTSGGRDNGPNPRVESGAIQFGEDWKGLFLRGDEAAFFAVHLNTAITLLENNPDAAFTVLELKAIRDLIQKEVLQ
jgi:hypothetical protein